MSTWRWILAAASLLLVLHALRLLFSGGGKEGGDKKRRSLGCGFVLAAAAVWSFTFAEPAGGLWPGARLAVGLTLVLLGIQSFVRRSIVSAVALLIAGLFLGIPPGQAVWGELAPPTRVASALHQVEDGLAESREAIAGLEAGRVRLAAAREDLAAGIRATGLTDFAALEGDPEALDRLREMREIDRMLATQDAAEQELRSRIERLELAQRRLARMADQEESLGVSPSDLEVSDILRDVEGAPPGPRGPTTVEEHVERAELQELYEREFE